MKFFFFPLLVFTFLCSSLAGCYYPVQPLDMSDPGITARVKAELKADPSLNISHIDINTQLGVVVLSGRVDSWEQKEAITKKARRVRGVKELIANILIQE
jgi:hyperosmotically inducible protein